MAIPVIEFDLIQANKIPSLTTAISNVIVYISQRARSQEYLMNKGKMLDGYTGKRPEYRSGGMPKKQPLVLGRNADSKRVHEPN